MMTNQENEYIEKAKVILEERKDDVLILIADMLYHDEFDIRLSDVSFGLTEEIKSKNQQDSLM